MAESDKTDDRVTRVVTRGGDQGETAMGMGVRVPKDAMRVEAYGTVDEANAAIGELRALVTDDPELSDWLRQIQVDLFNIGADLHIPGDAGASLRITADPMERLERELDTMNRLQPRLANFVLPTGSPAAAKAHGARTVVRRAERRVVTLARTEEVNPEVLRYLNRLSDFLFVAARRLNDNGSKDDLWAPRGVR